MGDMTFSEMKEAVKLRHGGRTDMDSWGTSSLDYYGVWVNKAYTELAVGKNILGTKWPINFRELETSTTATTADGTAYVSAPTDVIAIRRVYDSTNDRQLDMIPWSKYISYTDRTDTSAEGDPDEYVRSGDYIYLHPTPDAEMTMTIFYKKRPAELSGTQQSVLGAEWDEVIVAMAAYKGFQWLGDWEAAKNVRGEILELIANRMSIYNDEERARTDTWGPSPAYDTRRSY